MKAYRKPYDPTPEEIQRECERIREEKQENPGRTRSEIKDYVWQKTVYRNPARLWRHGLH